MCLASSSPYGIGCIIFLSNLQIQKSNQIYLMRWDGTYTHMHTNRKEERKIDYFSRGQTDKVSLINKNNNNNNNSK